MEIEQYRPFHDYEVTSHGRVIGKNGKLLKLRDNNGRHEIRLNIDDKRLNFIVGRLVYYVFEGFDIEDKNLCVVTKDGNNLNNHIDNLKLVKRKDIIQGERHKSIMKLTDEQIEEIKRLYKGTSGKNQHDKTGYSYNDLAKIYGVTKSNIAAIIKGRSRNKEDYKLK